MKFSRTILAATLSSALVLTACSGEDPAEEQGSGPATQTTQTSDGDSATAGTTDDGGTTAGDDAARTDQAGTTAGAADEESATEVAMATEEVTAALPLEEAEEVAATVLTARFQADQGDSDDITDLQRKSMMGNVRTAHEAADQLEAVNGEPPQVDLADAPVEPIVLAISKDDGELPMFLLVQTVPEEGGVPLLHLLESRTGESADFRISWEAPMLPGTELPSFDRRSVGSPVLRSGSGDLTTAPRDLLKSVATYISYPQPEDVPDYRTHGYAPAVRSSAQAQADAVAGQATLQEKNWLVSEDTKTLLFDDGSAFVMGTLLRDTQFQVDDGAELNPPDTFRVFQDTSVLTDEAVLRTMVFIGMRAPSEQVEFKPEMIAAREQLVDAWGE
ncbi:hypothetical protein [Ornithinimicrobium sufpigmenti]|uniref:hypothetical protein n=1 Tax=Ornithinimicrobium sufpigmenti TaxID=2508882 RepID=UPI0010355301|nr:MULTISPECIES: hypothetical protein [unclassified Ornithinimicrobium]